MTLRYKLRTLLIALALGPPTIWVLTIAEAALRAWLKTDFDLN